MSTLSRVEVFLILLMLSWVFSIAAMTLPASAAARDCSSSTSVPTIVSIAWSLSRPPCASDGEAGQAARKAAAAMCSHVLSVVVLIVIAGSL